MPAPPLIIDVVPTRIETSGSSLTMNEAGHRTESLEPPNKTRHFSLASLLFELVFYLVLVAIALLVLLYSSTNNAPRNIFGFSACTVLTSSMQSEIPVGSFVLIKHVDPATLQVGDDITYLRTATTTVTHRIITIYENYDGNGNRGFETKGIENTRPDQAIVIADNIVGKVIFHNLTIGLLISFIRDNLLTCAVMVAMILGLFAALRLIFSPAPEKRGATATETKSKQGATAIGTKSKQDKRPHRGHGEVHPEHQRGGDV